MNVQLWTVHYMAKEQEHLNKKIILQEEKWALA